MKPLAENLRRFFPLKGELSEKSPRVSRFLENIFQIIRTTTSRMYSLGQMSARSIIHPFDDFLWVAIGSDTVQRWEKKKFPSGDT